MRSGAVPLLQQTWWLSCYGDSQALEALAKLKKEKTQEAKELKLKLENLRTHRDAAQKLRADVTQGTARNTEHMQKIQDFEDQMQVGHRTFESSSVQQLSGRTTGGRRCSFATSTA